MQRLQKRWFVNRRRSTNKVKRARLRRFQKARNADDAKLHALPNVIGSCFGIKKTAGGRTGDLCLTVFVRKKLPRSKLPAKHRVPQTLPRHGMDLPTDVVVVGKLREEFGFAFDDQTQLGTIGAFARRNGNFFGVTCAHCITGPDGDFNTPDRIRMEFPTRNSFLWAGQSDLAAKIPGTGVTPNFGNFDAGLIQISDATVSAYVQTRPALPVFRPSPSLSPKELQDLLLYTPVQGWGAKTNNIIRAQVEGVDVSFESEYFDLLIGDPGADGLTRKGDSGLMWIGPYGQAYGIHMMGDGGGADNSSVHSLACFASRISDDFQLHLLTT